MRYLVDTGVWLRLFDRSDPEHAAVRRALQYLRSGGHSLAACPQNIAEFWNVSTRPVSARGGYGNNVATTELRVQFIERNASILNDLPSAYRDWRSLVLTYQVTGLAVHDARLVSAMIAAGVTHIVTLNVADFRRYSGIIATTPRDLVASAAP